MFIINSVFYLIKLVKLTLDQTITRFYEFIADNSWNHCGKGEIAQIEQSLPYSQW